MRILHILSDGPGELSDRIIEAQSADNRLEVVDLSLEEISYEEIVDRIFACDKVVSW